MSDQTYEKTEQEVAVEVLRDIATNDPNPINRLHAAQSLLQVAAEKAQNDGRAV